METNELIINNACSDQELFPRTGKSRTETSQRNKKGKEAKTRREIDYKENEKTTVTTTAKEYPDSKSRSFLFFFLSF